MCQLQHTCSVLADAGGESCMTNVGGTWVRHVQPVPCSPAYVIPVGYASLMGEGKLCMSGVRGRPDLQVHLLSAVCNEDEQDGVHLLRMALLQCTEQREASSTPPVNSLTRMAFWAYCNGFIQ